MNEQNVEQRFQKLREQLKPEEFNSVEWLSGKAQQIEREDEELSKRILVRVRNLKNLEAKKKQELGPIEPDGTNKPGDAPDEKQPVALAQKVASITQSLFFLCVVLPTLAFAFYQLLWATERFESQAKVIVQQPDGMATMDTSMALLSGLGMSSTGVSDTELVKAYILSNDMLDYLDSVLKLREHYSQNSIDIFSRMGRDDSKEEFLEYYQKHTQVNIDAKSSVIHIYSQAFESEYANDLTQTIVERAEWYINSIGHQLAEAQLEFIKREHNNVEQQLELAKTRLLSFQQRYNLLDPTAEGLAIQQITYGLEGQISVKEAELKGLLAIMSPAAPQVLLVKNELSALTAQLTKERSKLSDENNTSIPVSAILASYSELKVKMELALQAYTSSQISLEKSRIEAYRQLKYLIVVESATRPDESKYPNTFYNITLFAVLASMLFAIARIVTLTVHELR